MGCHSFVWECGLQDEFGEVFVFDDAFEFVFDVLGVDDDGFLFEGGGLETEVIQEAFHDGVESSGADILGGLIELVGGVGHFLDAVGCELELDPFGTEERLILFRHGAGRFGEDADEVVPGQVLKFDADGETALKFGHEVGGF